MELGLDRDWWLHVLVNPSKNDVITTERDRQRNLNVKTWLCVGCDVPCAIQELLLRKKNLKFTKSEITQAAWQQEILTFTAEGGLFLNTSQNSVTATIKTDSPRPPKAIIWHLSSVFPHKAAFSNRGLSQVSSTSPLLCCLLSQTPDLAVGIPPRCEQQRCVSLRSPNKVETAPCS